jgi:hypothetical protein
MDMAMPPFSSFVETGLPAGPWATSLMSPKNNDHVLRRCGQRYERAQRKLLHCLEIGFVWLCFSRATKCPNAHIYLL